MFKLWSELNKKALEELKPDLGARSWNDLPLKDKELIWSYLEWYFFKKNEYSRSSEYEFFGEYISDKDQKENRIRMVIVTINEMYKVKNFTPNFKNDYDSDSACKDFYSIYLNGDENIVFELFSLYGKAILLERNKLNPYRNTGESDEDLEKRAIEWRFEIFDDFAKRFNEVFGDFGINIYLTRLGFVPRQESKIMKEVYEPTIQCLSNPIWKSVNTNLSDAFDDFKKNTPQGYSSSITNAVTGIQAFLQILLKGKTGKGDISVLIKEAINKGVIPNDIFSKNIFKNMEGIFAEERQNKGNAHPKIEYSNNKNARLILNLTMIFIQHCLQFK